MFWNLHLKGVFKLVKYALQWVEAKKELPSSSKTHKCNVCSEMLQYEGLQDVRWGSNDGAE